MCIYLSVLVDLSINFLLFLQVLDARLTSMNVLVIRVKTVEYVRIEWMDTSAAVLVTSQVRILSPLRGRKAEPGLT